MRLYRCMVRCYLGFLRKIANNNYLAWKLKHRAIKWFLSHWLSIGKSIIKAGNLICYFNLLVSAGFIMMLHMSWKKQNRTKKIIRNKKDLKITCIKENLFMTVTREMGKHEWKLFLDSVSAGLIPLLMLSWILNDFYGTTCLKAVSVTKVAAWCAKWPPANNG